MSHHLQPLLNGETVLLSAPTQAWSDAAGEMGASAIHGLYHADTRVLSTLTLTVGGAHPEHIATLHDGASAATFASLLRELDGPQTDPKVRMDRHRSVSDAGLAERLTLSSALLEPVRTSIRLGAGADFSPMNLVKAGAAEPDASLASRVDGASIRWSAGTASAVLTAPGAAVTTDDARRGSVLWQVTIPPRGTVTVEWSIAVSDASAVVRGATAPCEWNGFSAHGGDSRLERWLVTALSDLEALRMTACAAPGETFLAAGAPWFFTLFGRDSIWSARFLLPLGTGLPASTLRALALLQGTKDDPRTAEQPGKILHELRHRTSTIPGGNVTLPPLYYGTVDATPLWVCLLHDAWRRGMPAEDVEALLPHLEAALCWMRDYGDSDGDGFLEYVDSSGHGLANQGWKDSGDSIQWNDGRLAEGPIALCEVQGYAYEAAVGGAALLEHFGRPGANAWRGWAAALKERFAQEFWIRSPADGCGPYPAVALDAHKRRVDSVTSNIGHLLGTGILDARGVGLVADRLTSPELNSGYGVRTMSTAAAGYWPLSYHGGSVWTHDTAIAIVGLAREGLGAHAAVLIEGLLAAAEGFQYRMPELHSGDARIAASSPVPYPAACRPQAWSAAASVAVLSSVLELRSDAAGGTIPPAPAQER